MPLIAALPTLKSEFQAVAEELRAGSDIAAALEHLAQAIHNYTSQAQVVAGQQVTVAIGQLVVGTGPTGPISGATTTPGSGTVTSPGTLL
jgi:hypothetical protein